MGPAMRELFRRNLLNAFQSILGFVTPLRVGFWLRHPGCDSAVGSSGKGILLAASQPAIRNPIFPHNEVSGYVGYPVETLAP